MLARVSCSQLAVVVECFVNIVIKTKIIKKTSNRLEHAIKTMLCLIFSISVDRLIILLTSD